MHEKVAKLVIERATVIFNLLARHLTRWSCRASERYNVLARTGPAVWKVRRASAYVEGCTCIPYRAGSNYTKSLQLQLQLLRNINFNYNYNYTTIKLYSITITITPCSFQLQLQLQFRVYVNDTFLWWNLGLIDLGCFPVLAWALT